MRQAVFLILGQACANLLYFFQQCVDALVQHFEGNLIVAAFRNDDVGEFFARFDELLVHRLDRAEVLAHNGVERTPSLVYITEDSADDSHIRVRIDEHLNVKQISEFLTFKNQNTLYDDDLRRAHRNRFINSVMYGKIIHRPFDAFSLCKLFDMLNHQIRIERVWMVIVEMLPLFKRNIIVLLVIKIMADDCYFFAEFFFNSVYHRAFATARSARDSDYDYIVHHDYFS